MAGDGGSWWGDLDPFTKLFIIFIVSVLLFFGCIFTTGGLDARVPFPGR